MCCSYIEQLCAKGAAATAAQGASRHSQPEHMQDCLVAIEHQCEKALLLDSDYVIAATQTSSVTKQKSNMVNTSMMSLKRDQTEPQALHNCPAAKHLLLGVEKLTLKAIVRMASDMLISSWRSLVSGVASTRNSARESPSLQQR